MDGRRKAGIYIEAEAEAKFMLLLPVASVRTT
jgi:hypothetical protein